MKFSLTSKMSWEESSEKKGKLIDFNLSCTTCIHHLGSISWTLFCLFYWYLADLIWQLKEENIQLRLHRRRRRKSCTRMTSPVFVVQVLPINFDVAHLRKKVMYIFSRNADLIRGRKGLCLNWGSYVSYHSQKSSSMFVNQKSLT